MERGGREGKRKEWRKGGKEERMKEGRRGEKGGSLAG